MTPIGRGVHRRHRGAFLLGVAVALAPVACGDSTAAPETPVASVVVSPPEASMAVGDTVRLAAVALSSRGDVLGGRAFAWASDRGDIASVDPSGLVTAHASGRANITAATGDHSGSSVVNVATPEAPVSSVVVSPPEASMAVGDTVRFAAAALSSHGEVVLGRTFAWASDRVDIASVDPSGLVTAHASGRANITAATGDHSGSSVVDVATPPETTPEIFSLSPSTIQAGWSNFTLTVRGANIPPQARVTWNGAPLESFFVTATEIRATVSSSYVAAEGSAEVRVETPMPDPRTSNPLPFTIFARPALSVELLLSGNATVVGDRIPLRAVARDQFGEIIEGKRITWTSSDTMVARVEGDVLRGLKVGTVDLVAESYPTFSGTAFHVVEAPVREIGFHAWPSTAYPELFRRSLEPPGTVRRLLAPGTSGRDMTLSPDGTKIAFVGNDGSPNDDIYVMNVDGTGLMRLTTEAGIDDRPAWSPDGLSLAFRSYRQGKPDIWVMDADGENPVNLTFASVFIPEEQNGDPAWSPDGETLVFSRGFGLGQALYKVNRDGSNLRLFLEWPGMDLSEAAWSADDVVAFRRFDRAQGSGRIEFVSGSTGEALYFFWPIHAGARSPLFLGGGWLAVSAPVHPESTLPTVAFYHLSAGYVVAPMGQEFGRLERPAVMVR